MAIVLFADGTSINQSLTGERMEKVWVSPSDTDSADTVVFPTVTGKTLIILSAFDNSLGASVTATVSGFTVTLDAAGAATDQVYAIKYMYL